MSQTIYAIVDNRYENALIGFTALNETMTFTHGSDALPFNVYQRFYSSGGVSIPVKVKRMNSFFVKHHCGKRAKVRL